MKIKSNFHTHTCMCDGKNTAEEIVAEAIRLGMDTIGISGHSHTAFDESYCMSHEVTREYVKKLKELKETNSELVNVLAGLEMDFYSDAERDGLDYVIGSAHYIKVNDEYVPVDESAEITRDAIDKHYDGDALAFAEDYFEMMGQMVEKTKCQIIGHFNLITKFNEKTPKTAGDGMTEWKQIFDEKDPRYVAAYTAALEKLIPTGLPFEINTGAISRGYRTAPYPSVDILKKIHEMGGKVCLSSDSHEASTLLYWFDEAEQLAREIGFEKVTLIGPDGPYEVEL